MKKLIILMLCTTLMACGKIERTTAMYKGYSKMCIDGISYIQFTSGATVQLEATGKPVTCK